MKLHFLLFILLFFTFLAQAQSEDPSRYQGPCLTHEDRSDAYQIKKTLVPTLDPSSISRKKLKNVIKKMGGKKAFQLMLETVFPDFKSELGTERARERAFRNYVDDFTVETLVLKRAPSTPYYRYSVGYGGGNGGYLVVLKTGKNFKEISLTGDGDLYYCDASVSSIPE